MVKYIYDGLLPAAERDNSGMLLASYTRIPGRPGGIGGMISRWNNSVTNYYHSLILDNVTQISDSSGSIVQAYDYDAFGNIVSQSGSLENTYKYQTKEASVDTGLVYFGARYYNPLTGRFITPDPLGMIDGANLYRYCWNNPVNYSDPYGLDTGFGWGGFWGGFWGFWGFGGGAGAESGIDWKKIHGPEKVQNNGGCNKDGGGSYFRRKSDFGKKGSSENPIPLRYAPGGEDYEIPQGPKKGKERMYKLFRIAEYLSKFVARGWSSWKGGGK